MSSNSLFSSYFCFGLLVQYLAKIEICETSLYVNFSFSYCCSLLSQNTSFNVDKHRNSEIKTKLKTIFRNVKLGTLSQFLSSQFYCGFRSFWKSSITRIFQTCIFVSRPKMFAVSE